MLWLHCKPKQWKKQQQQSIEWKKKSIADLEIDLMQWKRCSSNSNKHNYIHEINANDVWNANSCIHFHRWWKYRVGNRMKFSGIINESISSWHVNWLMDILRHQLPIAIWNCHHQSCQEFTISFVLDFFITYSQYYWSSLSHLSMFLCSILITVVESNGSSLCKYIGMSLNDKNKSHTNIDTAKRRRKKQSNQ